MITINNVSKNYKKTQALIDINFFIEKNQIVGLVGPNGAGKSTLMRIISGINHPSSGEVLVKTDYLDSAKTQISTVFDFNGLYSQLTAYENLQFFLRLKNQQIVNQENLINSILHEMQLLEWKDRKTKEFSKGMLRKLTIARAIITNPNILILDEPFDGLDIESHRFVIDFLKNWVMVENRSILFASHNMSDIEDFCSKVIIINKGKIVVEKQINDIKNEGYKYLKIRFSKAYQIINIKNALKKFNIEVKPGCLKNEVYIYSEKDMISQIINKLCMESFEIDEVIKECINVEDVYLKTIGGIL
ncbi:MAG: ABC transporter ATP-binding protein [Lachnospiraceae bacterium]|nr:ABC transporter ATP-binding protein [Lachnospiraceae bacterium]